MIERTNCRGVRCRGKTNFAALRSQTMNQRARHAFASFTGSDNRKHETIVGMRGRDEWSDRGLRDRRIDAWEERESGLGKREKEKRLPEAEIAVSVLAFINASVAGDAALKVSASSVNTQRNKTEWKTSNESERKAMRDSR